MVVEYFRGLTRKIKPLASKSPTAAVDPFYRFGFPAFRTSSLLQRHQNWTLPMYPKARLMSKNMALDISSH
jgi:hypothetical protein